METISQTEINQINERKFSPGDDGGGMWADRCLLGGGGADRWISRRLLVFLLSVMYLSSWLVGGSLVHFFFVFDLHKTNFVRVCSSLQKCRDNSKNGGDGKTD